MKTIVNIAMALGLCALLLTACDDDRSYADLLRDENHAVNAFLADQRVIGEVPADSVFECGPDAPYYQMDAEGNIYMQVLDPGTDLRPVTDDRVYFRFTRYNLSSYVSGEELTGGGNSDDISGDNGLGSLYFLLGNTSLQSSYVYGSGIQLPMYYLGNEARVNLIVKSQFGWTNEIAYVYPYLYNIRYYSSPLSPWAGAVED